jgi:transcriptional regulator with XRE-family HTH domain
MTIGERVALLRTRKGMSQTELSRVSGVPISVINMLESGLRSGENLRVGTAKKLARALVVTLDHLTGMYEDEESAFEPADADLVHV